MVTKVGSGLITIFFVVASLLCIYGIVTRPVDSTVFIIFMIIGSIFSVLIAFDFFHAFRNYTIENSD